MTRLLKNLKMFESSAENRPLNKQKLQEHWGILWGHVRPQDFK